MRETPTSHDPSWGNEMIAALTLFGVMLAQPAVGSADTLRLTLAEARARAVAAAPTVRIAAAGTAAAGAAYRTAGMIAANPGVSVAWPASLSGGGDRFEAGFTQPLDVTVTRSLRKSVGAAGLARARLMEEDARRLAEYDVAVAFAALHASMQRVAVATEVAANLDRLVEAARIRLDAGEISVLEADMVAIAAARVRPALVNHGVAMREAGNRLTALLGFEAGTAIVPLETTAADASLRGAGASCRPDLLAMNELVRENRLRSRLARAEALPVPAFTILHEREPGTSGWWGIGFEMTLPLWSRGGALAASHAAEAEMSLIAAAAAAREIDADRRALENQVAASAAALEPLRVAALELAGASAVRLLEGYRSGEIDLVDMLRLRDELDQVRFDYWDAWEAHQRALAGLRTAGSPSEECHDGL